jgi:hypothetical protein
VYRQKASHSFSKNWPGRSSGLWRTSVALFMFKTFPLLPPCLLIVPPDTVQATGNLHHH